MLILVAVVYDVWSKAEQSGMILRFVLVVFIVQQWIQEFFNTFSFLSLHTHCEFFVSYSRAPLGDWKFTDSAFLSPFLIISFLDCFVAFGHFKKGLANYADLLIPIVSEIIRASFFSGELDGERGFLIRIGDFSKTIFAEEIEKRWLAFSHRRCILVSLRLSQPAVSVHSRLTS